jgi:hypothetical protein
VGYFRAMLHLVWSAASIEFGRQIEQTARFEGFSASTFDVFFVLEWICLLVVLKVL